MRAETSVTTTLLHSKAELPMSDSILRFSDSPMPYNARSLRFGYDFLAFPSFSGGGNAWAWYTSVWRERSLLTEYVLLRKLAKQMSNQATTDPTG